MNEKIIPISELTYEKAFEALESIVNKLESEENDLNDALTLFESGQALAQHCSRLLESAELKVKQLIGDAISDFEIEA